MAKIYSWERRWLEISASKTADGPFYQVESNGYVAANKWSVGLQQIPIGISLEEIVHARQVVVLLGEPGIGKSSEWKKLNAMLRGNQQHLFLNLGSFSSEVELQESILYDAVVLEWLKNDYILTLWLDSLDEGLLHMKKLQDTLLRILRRLPLEKLRVRITCRNAVWPATFTESLNDLWKFGPFPTKEQLSVLLLRPLTQQQVADAAQVEGLVPEGFLGAVSESDAQPLASIPVTLRLLLNLYKKHQPGFGLAGSTGRAGLYELGCLELCDGPDQNRDDAHRQDGRQRLVLAGYLAYLAVFSNRRQIHIEPVRGELEENALDPYAAGAGLTAAWGEVRAVISPTAIRDLLKNTSLFTDLGNGCLVWAHQAFAEFLAAWYVNITNISIASLRALFRSEADPSGGLVPALRETAAWLAELQSSFWQELLVMDPLALIQSDLRRLRDEQRAAIVAHLATAIGKLAFPPYLESRNRSFMQQLSHPGLAVQLEPLITSDNVPWATRRFAMDIAKGCAVVDLVPTLVQQALDSTQSYNKRASAVNILREIATDEAKQAVKVLIHHIPEEDTRDDFRGDLIWMLWPTHLSPDELLPLLTPDKDERYGGTYRQFLYHLDRENIQFSAGSVQNSLQWIRAHASALELQYRRTDFWQRIQALIWDRAWQLADEPGMFEAMADTYAALVENHDYISTDGASDIARLTLFKSIIIHHSNKLSWVSVIVDRTALVKQSDWDAVFPLLYNPMSFSQREWLSRILLRFLTDSLYDEDMGIYCQRYEQFLTASRRYASVRKVWRGWYKSVVLKSKKAREDRKQWLDAQKRKKKSKKKTKNRRRIYLHKIANKARFVCWVTSRQVYESCGGWRALFEQFTYNKNKKSFSVCDEFSDSQRWQKLSPVRQNKILDTVWCFVQQYPTPPENWYSQGNYHTCGATMLRNGLTITYNLREQVVRSLPTQFWQAWAPFIVRFDDTAREGSRFELLRLAAVHAPVEVDGAIILSIDRRDDAENGDFERLKDWYRLLPNAKFPALLLLGIEYQVWREDLCARMLITMLEEAYEPAWEYANELLSLYSSGASTHSAIIVAVYCFLLFHKKSASFDVWKYWEIISNHPSIASKVIEAEVNHYTPSEFVYLTTLEERQLESLALWLTYVFDLTPADVDDWDDDTPRGKYAALRKAAVAELASRGTTSAWEMIEYLDEQLGNPFWLKARIDQVRENLRRNAWIPALPSELIELSQQTSKRWIRSAADLQDLVVESLTRMQTDMHNELAIAHMLWIPQKQGNKQVGHEIRDENFYSDVIRFYLDKDLRRPEILIKREVEIRKSIGKGTGQRTDIYIDAFSRNKTGEKINTVTLVIEVKLVKNDEVETAIKGQLIPYLTDQHYKHGIYLVGWHYGQYDALPSSKKGIVELHQILKSQTQSVVGDYSIRTLIMDIRLPADTERVNDVGMLFDAI